MQISNGIRINSRSNNDVSFTSDKINSISFTQGSLKPLKTNEQFSKASTADSNI